MECDATAAAPGEAITVTASLGPARAARSNRPAFVVRPISGASGHWTMTETPNSAVPWKGVRYRGQFAAASPGRFRLEAVLGAGRTAASCDITVGPTRVASRGISP